MWGGVPSVCAFLWAPGWVGSLGNQVGRGGSHHRAWEEGWGFVGTLSSVLA